MPLDQQGGGNTWINVGASLSTQGVKMAVTVGLGQAAGA